MITFVPTNKRILVKPEKPKEKTEGGLYIPDMAKDKPVTGDVVAVAEDCEIIEMGMTVMYGKFAGTKVELDSQTFILMPEKEVLGYLEEFEEEGTDEPQD